MNCGLCGDRNSTRHLALESGITLVKCRSCGLVYNPDFVTREDAYAGADYFTRKNDYVRRWDEFRDLFGPLISRIRDFRKDGRLLDVGAGIGAFLHAASLAGFRATGVEISEWASAYARDEKHLDVLTGSLEDAHFGDQSFDIVVLNHVLEHVERPAAVLREARRILKTGGLLVVGAPNIGSIMARVLGARWASLRPDEHVWHFTPATLARIVSMAGLTVIRQEARENNPVRGRGLKDSIRRAINSLSVLTNRSEAMLLFAEKRESGPS